MVKVQLRSFEESEKVYKPQKSREEDSVMNAKSREISFKCYTCGKMGHKSFQYPINNKVEEKETYRRPNRWCENCNSRTHDTNYCRKKNYVKVVTVSDREETDEVSAVNSYSAHSFAFKVNASNTNRLSHISSDSLLVDCGATTHIVTNKSKFVKFDENFEPVSHTIELADGSRTSGVASGRGVAGVKL